MVDTRIHQRLQCGDTKILHQTLKTENIFFEKKVFSYICLSRLQVIISFCAAGYVYWTVKTTCAISLLGGIYLHFTIFRQFLNLKINKALWITRRNWSKWYDGIIWPLFIDLTYKTEAGHITVISERKDVDMYWFSRIFKLWDMRWARG